MAVSFGFTGTGSTNGSAEALALDGHAWRQAFNLLAPALPRFVRKAKARFLEHLLQGLA